MNLSISDVQQLQDGFQELFNFKNHRLLIRGFNAVDWLEDTIRQQEYTVKSQFYISWDAKQVILWKHEASNGFKPSVVQHIKFSNQPNFICAVVHVTKMKVFLAAALDMSFKVLDRNLNQLESIRHEERAILQMEYDNEKDLIFTSGASGISAWRLYRNLTIDKAIVMEKLYSFEGCDNWISHMIIQPKFNRIFALKERSVQVLSTTRRAVITILEDIHDSPVNTICWYERNQFYITGCSRGEIKCWTSNYTMKEAPKSNSPLKSNFNTSTIDTLGAVDETHNNEDSKSFALLHTFKGHSKAVTSICLHPVSGLAISAGLDGLVKVINLEALNELFSIQCEVGIVNLKVISLDNSHHGILFSLTDASIKLWQITSVCDFFAVSGSAIKKLESFDNMEAENEIMYRIKQQETKAPHHHHHHHHHTHHVFSQNSDQFNPFQDFANEFRIQEPVKFLDGGSVSDRILSTFSNQDLRLFSHAGKLIGRLEPEFLVEGIRSFSVSVYQKILICVCEGDILRVHDLNSFKLPMIFELRLKNDKNKNQKDNNEDFQTTNQSLALTDRSPHKSITEKSKDENSLASTQNNAITPAIKNAADDISCCCVLIDVAPTGILRAPKLTQSSMSNNFGAESNFKYNIKNEKVPEYIECYLVIGLKTGSLLVLDAFNNFEVQMNFQANHGEIIEMKYRHKSQELIILGRDFSRSHYNIKIWKLPNFDLISQTEDLSNISTFSISSTLNFFAIGLNSGILRLFQSIPEENNITELALVSENHEASVSSICFCDELRIIVSTSIDGKVKFWDFEKRLIRSIQLIVPSCGVISNGSVVGDILMAQNHYLLTIPKRIWDEGDLLNQMKLNQELLNTALKAEFEDKKFLTKLDGELKNGTPENTETEMSSSLKRVSISEKKSISAISDRRSSRRYSNSKAIENDSTQATTQNDDENDNQKLKKRPSVAIIDRKNSFRARQGSILSRKQSNASSCATLVSSISNKSEETEEDYSNNLVSIEDIEKKIILPAVKEKQYQYIYKNSSNSIFPSNEMSVSENSNPLPNMGTQLQSSSPQNGTENPVKQLWEPVSVTKNLDSEFSTGDYIDPNSQKERKVFDVLHPRFLVQKKPPARMMKMEEIDDYMKTYVKNIVDRRLLNQRKEGSADIKVSDEYDQHYLVDKRRAAQFGLSPRARLTLLNSKPTESNPNFLSLASEAPQYQKNTSDFQEIQQMTNKTQDNMILNLVDMKVSDSYKKHRASLNKQRDVRFLKLQQRASMITTRDNSPQSKDINSLHLEVNSTQNDQLPIKRRDRIANIHFSKSNIEIEPPNLIDSSTTVPSPRERLSSEDSSENKVVEELYDDSVSLPTSVTNTPKIRRKPIKPHLAPKS